jgi:hypothetical protein
MSLKKPWKKKLGGEQAQLKKMMMAMVKMMCFFVVRMLQHT